MATIIPPRGTPAYGSATLAIVFTPDEVQMMLRTLTLNATYANAEVRRVLSNYLERLADRQLESEG